MRLSREQQREAMSLLLTDFTMYAPRVLKILPKAGATPVPLQLNTAQTHLHERIEEQRKDTGRVRVIVLKGRQQGISTYVEGRYFWHVSSSFGRKAYILTHEQKATDNLFGMVARYYAKMPDDMKPHLGAANAKELVFDRLDSRYEVATAGAKDTGRSGTAQYLHGSEAAFWKSAATHFAGIGQTIPNEPGTEIILESTANGTANVFHERWELAVRGESEYMAVFIPWFWQAEYRLPVPDGFVMDAEEAEYAQTYKLDAEQMAWRRNKIASDFGGDNTLFNQEYPASPAIAFASSSPRALINALLVDRARRNRDVEAVGPKIMGIDVADRLHRRHVRPAPNPACHAASPDRRVHRSHRRGHGHP